MGGLGSPRVFANLVRGAFFCLLVAVDLAEVLAFERLSFNALGIAFEQARAVCFFKVGAVHNICTLVVFALLTNAAMRGFVALNAHGSFCGGWWVIAKLFFSTVVEFDKTLCLAH